MKPIPKSILETMTAVEGAFAEYNYEEAFTDCFLDAFIDGWADYHEGFLIRMGVQMAAIAYARDLQCEEQIQVH